MKKIHLIGEKVMSKTDGQIHFVSTSRLAELYGLKRGEWISCYSDQPCQDRSAIHLKPRYDGAYKARFSNG